MKWIEIITLRSLVKANRQLVDELLCQLFQQKEEGQATSIKVYHESMVETDLSIHIHWATEALPLSTSTLGQQLLFALKGLGLISYSIWVEATSVK
ncbi:MAG: hypothetical protein HQK65_07845 [Desulfamplus sp.]|nr:hypothetical protein [Desulfamplus sp.]